VAKLFRKEGNECARDPVSYLSQAIATRRDAVLSTFTCAQSAARSSARSPQNNPQLARFFISGVRRRLDDSLDSTGKQAASGERAPGGRGRRMHPHSTVLAF